MELYTVIGMIDVQQTFDPLQNRSAWTDCQKIDTSDCLCGLASRPV